jgi:hypothetical protein
LRYIAAFATFAGDISSVHHLSRTISEAGDDMRQARYEESKLRLRIPALHAIFKPSIEMFQDSHCSIVGDTEQSSSIPYANHYCPPKDD